MAWVTAHRYHARSLKDSFLGRLCPNKKGSFLAEQKCIEVQRAILGKKPGPNGHKRPNDVTSTLLALALAVANAKKL